MVEVSVGFAPPPPFPLLLVLGLNRVMRCNKGNYICSTSCLAKALCCKEEEGGSLVGKCVLSRHEFSYTIQEKIIKKDSKEECFNVKMTAFIEQRLSRNLQWTVQPDNHRIPILNH